MDKQSRGDGMDPDSSCSARSIVYCMGCTPEEHLRVGNAQ